MSTIIKDLPPLLREKALLEYMLQRNLLRLSPKIKEECLSSTLKRLFYWEDSMDGFDYWDRINNNKKYIFERKLLKFKLKF